MFAGLGLGGLGSAWRGSVVDGSTRRFLGGGGEEEETEEIEERRREDACDAARDAGWVDTVLPPLV